MDIYRQDRRWNSRKRILYKHPEMVCGNLELTSSAYGPVPTCMPIEGSSLEDLLANACSRIEGQMTEASLVLDENEEKPRETIPADPDVRNYSYTVVNGEVYYRENAVMYKPENAVGMRAVTDKRACCAA